MPYLIGLLLALSNTLGARFVGLDRDRAFYPLVLGVSASYYVLFAITGGAIGIVAIEVVIMTLFLAVMISGFRVNLWWVVGGFIAHGLLDTLHGFIVANSGVPTWWPPFCAIYDLTAAFALAAMLTFPGRRGFGIAAEVSHA